MSALVHTSHLELTSPIELVFAAFSDAGQLERWFCDHAVVQPRAGGAYRFWGPSVYGTAREEDADQELVHFDAPQRLAFTWTLHGVPSEVSVELGQGDPERNPRGVRLALRHAFERAPEVPRADDLLDDLWRLLGGNLTRHLGGELDVVRVRFDEPHPRIERTIVIDAPRPRVWKALIEPGILARWMWASGAEVQARVGGRYRYGWTYEVKGRTVEGGPTRILQLQEPAWLVTDWPDWRGDPRVPDQQVSWRLDEHDGHTHVTLVHSGFQRTVDFSDFPFGWDEFLRGMKETVEAMD